MKKLPFTARVLGGIVALVLAWLLGGFAASVIFPDQPLINKMETSANKIGASFAILCAAFLLGRYLFRSFREVVICLVITEVTVLLMVLHFTGIWSFTLFDLSFNFGWLFTMTWNVAVAYLVGAWIGQFTNARAANHGFQVDAPQAPRR